MPLICYVKRKFSASSIELIDKANEIIAEYSADGYDLTLRQLYYQFVSRDIIKNNMKEYKRLGSIINDARLAGLIDWDNITDRTRNLHQLSSWDSPASIVAACGKQFRLDPWETQPYYVEVWIEKEALAGVFQRVCDELRVPMFACRGYTSQSEMWAAAMRLKQHYRQGQIPLILHFGDHDPSGIDMTRDIRERLELFMGGMDVKRMALNMDQVNEYSPPPNPAKLTDSRATSYIKSFGDESWELDALDPKTLSDLVRDEVNKVIIKRSWEASMKRESLDRLQISNVASEWASVVRWLGRRT